MKIHLLHHSWTVSTISCSFLSFLKSPLCSSPLNSQQLVQQSNKTRVKRSTSIATGSDTPTLVPVPMSEDIERMGESAEHLKYNVSCGGDCCVYTVVGCVCCCLCLCGLCWLG